MGSFICRVDDRELAAAAAGERKVAGGGGGGGGGGCKAPLVRKPQPGKIETFEPKQVAEINTTFVKCS